MPIYSGDDRRRFIPQALLQVLSALIDEIEDGPSDRRARLRTLRSDLCRIYRLEDPGSRASDVDVAQALAELDGEDIEDGI